MAKRKSQRRVRATYDSAQITDNNRRRWQYTDALSANSANTKDIRNRLIQRSRYECANNSYASGIVETLAQDCIGTGPRLQMSGNEDVHKMIERDWKWWCREIDYTKKLLVMRSSKCRDGEVFALKVTKPELKTAVKLYLQLFEPEQVQSHQSQSDPVDGIRLDSYGEPSQYRILEAHPGDATGINKKGGWVSRDQIIHYAYTTRPGQVRGIPEITPALELFVQLRAYTLSVLSSAETAANLSAIMYTDSGAEDADEVSPELSWEIERNTLKALPYGWKLAQFKAEQPTTSYPDFKSEILNEIARCLHVPFNVASGNSSGYNYASGRLDHTRYFKSLEVERAIINHTINDNLFADWLIEWGSLNGVATDAIDTSHTWQYDAQEHVDPLKTASAQEKRILAGVSNLSIEASKEGRDWEEVLKQRLAEELFELNKRKELGLPIRIPEQTIPNPIEEDDEDE